MFIWTDAVEGVCVFDYIEATRLLSTCVYVCVCVSVVCVYVLHRSDKQYYTTHPQAEV